jgi:glycine cleavage system H protein
LSQKNINMNIPASLKYTNDHEWVRVEGDYAFVGVTDFAQGELGDIVYVEIETEGEELGQGDVFGTVEAVKTVSDLFMPISGTVEEVNSELEANPENVNQDPYEKGWMIKIKIGDTSELDGLLSSDDYKSVTVG